MPEIIYPNFGVNESSKGFKHGWAGKVSELFAPGDVRETEFYRVFFGFYFFGVSPDAIFGNQRQHHIGFGMFRHTFEAGYGGSEGCH